MNQTGLPEIPEGLIILPNAAFKPTMTALKIKVLGVDELDFPMDIRSLEAAIPRNVDDQVAIAARIGKLVENTVRHLMGLKVGEDN